MEASKVRLTVPRAAFDLVIKQQGAREEAAKHATGWPHFLDRLSVLASGGDPGRDPWATTPPE
jgi:hypothetical protein